MPSALVSLIAPIKVRRAAVSRRRFLVIFQLAQLAVAVNVGDRHSCSAGSPSPYAGQHTREARSRNNAGRAAQHYNLIHLPAQLLGPAPQLASAKQSGFVIVSPEVGCARVRNLQRDQRNFRIVVFRGDEVAMFSSV